MRPFILIIGLFIALFTNLSVAQNCVSYATSVAHQVGVNNPNNSLNAPNTTVADLPDDNDLIVWDMGSVLPVGTEICVRVKKPSSGGNFDFKIWSGASGINVQTGSYTQLASYTNLNHNSLTDKCVTLTAASRYIKVTHEDNSDFSIDAVIASIPKPNAGNNQTVCANTIVNLSATASTGSWSVRTSPANPSTSTFGSSNNANTTVSGLSSVGTYGFIWTVGGCKDTVLVTTTSKPNAGADKTVADLYSTATMSATAVSGGAWTEAGSNPGLSVITNTTSATTTIVAFNKAGVYKYIWSANGCSDTASVTVGGCDCTDNKILNPSFESGSPTPTSWTASGSYATWVNDPFAAQCGSANSAQMDGNSNSSLAMFFQDVTIAGGSQINLKFKAGTHDPNQTAMFGLVFYNGNTRLDSVFTEVDHILDDGTMLGYSLSRTAPSNATKVRVIGKVGSNWLKVDLVCLNVTGGCTSTAGADGDTILCKSSTTAINLFNLIVGETSGGAWSKVSGSGATYTNGNSTFTPSGATSDYVFRYVVTGSGGCPNDTSLVNVTLTTPPNAGINGDTTICNTATNSLNLASLIDGESTGGAWSKVSGSGASYTNGNSTFNPTGATSNYVFRYVVSGTGGCSNDTSFATVIINTCCDGRITSLFFNRLSGSPDISITAGGNYQLSTLSNLYNLEATVSGTVQSVKFTITGPSASSPTDNSSPYNAPSSGTAWVPAAGAYSVKVEAYSADNAGGTKCHDTTINFTITSCTLGAGIDGDTSVCNSSTGPISLATVINGELSGGTWTRVTGTGGNFIAGTGSFTPSSVATTSSFRYIIIGSNGCPNDTSIATVTLTSPPNAGSNGDTTICSTSSNSINLTSLIDGESTGGAWSRVSGSGATYTNGNSTFNPTGATSNYVFRYVVTGTGGCANDTSLATVIINTCCDGQITNVFFKHLEGGSNIPIVNGGNYNLSSFDDLYDLEATTSGTIGSVKFTVGLTGQTGTSNTENASPYNANWDPQSTGSYTVTVTVYSGSNLSGIVCDEYTVVFNVMTLGSIGDYVWLDADGDGQQQSSEFQMTGIVVTLTKPDATTVKDTTDNDGKYLFSGLVPGTYSLSFTIPPAYTTTSSNSGSDATDSDINSSGIVSGIVLTSGQNNLTIDAGLKVTNCDCPENSTNLISNPGFEDALQSGYWTVSGGSLTTGDGYQMCGNKNAFLDHSSGTARMFREFPNIGPGSIVNLNIYAGTHNAGQSCSPWLKLIYLNSAGLSLKRDSVDIDKSVDVPDYLLKYFSISGVAPAGTDRIRVEITINCDYVKLDGFCLTATTTSSLGNFVWNDLDGDGVQDAGEPGISGVSVTLTNVNTSVTTGATTDLNGKYLFTGLTAGTYKVTFGTPSGFTASTVNVGADDKDSDAGTGGMTGNYVLSGGQIDTTVDAGFYKTASLGNFVWNDLNADGDQDAGEPGISGVSVTLTNVTTSVTGSPITTDANGRYIFTGLTPGTYKVTFSTPVGFTRSVANSGADDKDSDADGTGMSGNYVLISGQSDTTVDAGFYKTASLGNFVWNDLNADGDQDAGEPGINGVVVTLMTAAGATITSTSTGGTGKYLFTGLTPGTYKVNFGTPSGFTPSVANTGADDKDSDATGGGTTGNYVLTSGQVDTTVDAGFYKTASLGNFVWHDLNADGDQDAGEPGIGSASVTLTNVNTSVTTGGSTDVNGRYFFSGLTPGTYKVTFGTPAGFVSSAANIGADDKDSDANGGGMTGNYVLTSGQSDTTVDAGFYKTASLGNYVWEDLDGDGIQDSDEPPAFSPTTVILTNVNTGLTSETVTVGGYYLFSGLKPGTYFVTFIAPFGSLFTDADGGIDTLDSDANSMTGVTGNYLLTSGQVNLTVDAGFSAPAAPAPVALGNFVWNDQNVNGVQDNGELGIPNVGVTVTNTFTEATQTMTTNAAGRYWFDGLDFGTYRVTFATPAGYLPTTANAGGNDNTDSDAGVGGVTGNYTLAEGQEDSTIDAGFFLCPGNFPFDPISVCGTQTVNLTLYEPAGYTGGTWTLNGTPVANPTSVGQGSYLYSKVIGPGCTSTGTLVITKDVPDFTARITINPSTISGPSTVNVIIDVIEILDKASCDDVYVLVPVFGERYSFTYNSNLGQLGIFTISNSHWQYLGSNGAFHIWKYIGPPLGSPTFPVGGFSRFGFSGTYNNQGTSGETRFTVEVVQGSGGEINFMNNADGETLFYRRN